MNNKYNFNKFNQDRETHANTSALSPYKTTFEIIIIQVYNTTSETDHYVKAHINPDTCVACANIINGTMTIIRYVA